MNQSKNEKEVIAGWIVAQDYSEDDNISKFAENLKEKHVILGKSLN